jgi:hypothetical protein
LVVGGRHIGRGTRNTLANLGNGCYLEVVGPDPSQDRPDVSPFGVHDLKEAKLITWAARTDHMNDALAHARGAGYDAGVATEMVRETPGGEMLSWSLTEPVLDDGGLVPFLIDWLDTTHPTAGMDNGATLVELIGAHTAPDRIAKMLSALGVELSVHQGKKPSLTAVIDGPNGRFRLR